MCINFRDLNKATPKDEYPMPIANMLINEASGHCIINFLDGNAGYNQIFTAEEDMSKTAVRCLSFVGLFEWVVMTFGLKNAGATYQRAMNLIFHDLLGICCRSKPTSEQRQATRRAGRSPGRWQALLPRQRPTIPSRAWRFWRM